MIWSDPKRFLRRTSSGRWRLNVLLFISTTPVMKSDMVNTLPSAHTGRRPLFDLSITVHSILFNNNTFVYIYDRNNSGTQCWSSGSVCEEEAIVGWGVTDLCHGDIEIHQKLLPGSLRIWGQVTARCGHSVSQGPVVGFIIGGKIIVLR